MTRDITFCKAIDCPYRFNCKRNKMHYNFGEELISECDFEHTITKCEYFIQK